MSLPNVRYFRLWLKTAATIRQPQLSELVRLRQCLGSRCRSSPPSAAAGAANHDGSASFMEIAHKAHTRTPPNKAGWPQTPCHPTGKLARPERLELPTPRFVVWCSIQLSYGRSQARGCSGTPVWYQPPKPRPSADSAARALPRGKVSYIGRLGACCTGRYATSLSSSRRIDSPITPVPTLALPGAMISAVRRPFFSTLTQAFSISSASSSMLKE
jgi:hypothetical protein